MPTAAEQSLRAQQSAPVGGRARLGLAAFDRRYLPHAVFLIAFLVLVGRLPEALFRAEFWAEEGLFYSQALADGIGSLVQPYAGYLHTANRVIAYLETFMPAAFAPLLGNLVSFLVMAGVAAFATSSRMPWGQGPGVLIAFGIVLLPIGFELVGTLVHVVWPLTLWVALVALSREPDTPRGRLAEGIGLVAAGLTGLGAVLAAPLYFRASRRRILLVGTLALVQVLVIAFTFHTRNGGPGADWALVPYVWVLRAIVTPLVGAEVAQALPGEAVVIIGLVVATAAAFLLRGTRARSRGLVVLLIVIVPLLGIAVGGESTHELLNPVWAPRYFWLAGVGIVILIAVNRRRPLALAIAALLVVGIIAEVRIHPAATRNWAEHSSCIGGPTACEIPVAPAFGPGERWNVIWRPSE